MQNIKLLSYFWLAAALLSCKLNSSDSDVQSKREFDIVPNHLSDARVESKTTPWGYALKPKGIEIQLRPDAAHIANRDHVPWNRIVIHHQAQKWSAPIVKSKKDSKKAWLDMCKQQFDQIVKHHTQVNKWDDIGYQFVVCPSGEVFEGRVGKWVTGAQAHYQNQGSAGILLMGQYSTEPKHIKDLKGLNSTVPDAQIEATARLVAWIAADSTIDINSPNPGKSYVEWNIKRLLTANKKLLMENGCLIPSNDEINKQFPKDIDKKQNVVKVQMIGSELQIPALTYHTQMANALPEKQIENNEDHYATACPGKLLIEEIPEILKRANNQLKLYKNITVTKKSTAKAEDPRPSPEDCKNLPIPAFRDEQYMSEELKKARGK